MNLREQKMRPCDSTVSVSSNEEKFDLELPYFYDEPPSFPMPTHDDDPFNL